MSDTEGINGDWPRADHIQCKRVLDQYLTELEQARAEVAQERESVRHQFRMLEELRAEFRRVKAEAERYRAALEQYADEGNWHAVSDVYGWTWAGPMVDDDGPETARTALRKEDDGE